jgi:DNA-binding MarR family transcriptional regulator
LITQQLKAQVSPAGRAFGRLLRAHATLRRELDLELAASDELTVSEYEVLLLLSRAPERKMRRVDLANEVRLSPSGVTRMLDRLEEDGLVEKGPCSTDARVSYAVLSDEGVERFRQAAPRHFDAVERLLGGRLDEAELESLAALLDRLAAADDGEEPCQPG